MAMAILQNLTKYDRICNMNNTTYNKQPHSERVKASELSLWLMSRGISSITTGEIAALIGVPKNQVSQRLASPKKRNEIVLLANGLWAPVPPEYLTWGAPPAIDIIDALMRHLDADYYVGWLTAAALHGASHHAPQVFQVAASRAIRTKRIGRSRIRFYHRNPIHHAAIVQIQSRSGPVSLSSREMTMLDIADGITIVGGIDHAANLIVELCESATPDMSALSALSIHYPSSVVRRLGYLLERYAGISALEQLKAISDGRETTVSLLDPQFINAGAIDPYWRLKINREVQPDV